jgi:GT2 family glycosyltransferase
MEAGHRQDCWLVGTAVLLRAAAVRQAGLFESSYFAYFEDNELAVRFARKGYFSRMAFDARVLHFTPWQMEEQRASYFFYLMARNEMRFWVDNTPGAWRRPVRYRVVQRAITHAWRLRQRGLQDKADACLLGAWDGLLKRGGPPVLNRPVPALMAFVYFLAIARGAPK